VAEIPEELLRRSAEAKARATGRPVAEILAELKGETRPPEAAPAPGDPAPSAPGPDAAEEEGTLAGKARAAAAALPEHLLRRAAEAKAAALGMPVDQVMAEMTGRLGADTSATASAPAAPGEGTAPTAEAPAAAPTPAATPTLAAPAGDIDWAAAAGAAGMPEKLLRRSVEAKAKASGRPVAEVLTEVTGIQPAPAAPGEGTAPTAEAPAAAPTPAATPTLAAPAGDIDWAAAAGAAGMPEKLLRRSVEAKAKASGRPVAEVLTEVTGIQPAAATGAAAPAPTSTTAAPAAGAATPAPSLPPVPEGVSTQRLLTVVKARAIQGARREPTDKVYVWPHLLAIEFVALLVVLALLVVFSVFQDAPLLELANPNAQPNPSKAPWYFLGLQELLTYFDPQVAGVLIPGLGLAALAIIPYIDRNPSTRPSDRKFAIMLFTFFVVAAAILTIIGSFYRGKGFNFTFPWRDGIFFDL